MLKRLELTTLLLSTALIGTACTSPSLRDIQSFGASTKALSEVTAETFDLVNEWAVQRKIYDAASAPSLTVDTSTRP